MKTNYEFLNIHLNNGKTALDKQRNKEKLQIAEAIKARRITEIQCGAYGIVPLHSKFLARKPK